MMEIYQKDMGIVLKGTKSGTVAQIGVMNIKINNYNNR